MHPQQQGVVYDMKALQQLEVAPHLAIYRGVLLGRQDELHA
jgi:hypothetical protein